MLAEKSVRFLKSLEQTFFFIGMRKDYRKKAIVFTEYRKR
jgi:hypothetical protein